MAAAQPYITGVSGDFPEGQIVPRQLVGINLILIRCRGVLQCYLDECARVLRPGGRESRRCSGRTGGRNGRSASRYGPSESSGPSHGPAG